MGVCVAGNGCVAVAATGSAGEAWHGPFCAADLDLARRDVASLTADYHGLSTVLDGRSAGHGTRVSGSVDAGVLVDLGVDELMRDIHHCLTVWEPPVREVAGLPPERTRGVRHGFAVAVAVGVLAPRIAILAALPPVWGYADGLDAGPVCRDGVDAISSLRSLRRRCRHRLGLTTLINSLPGECSGCGAAALRRRDGSDTVRCDMCRQTSTYDEYRRYVGLILGPTAGEISAELADVGVTTTRRKRTPDPRSRPKGSRLYLGSPQGGPDAAPAGSADFPSVTAERG
jgi:hypothetical protein